MSEMKAELNLSEKDLFMELIKLKKAEMEKKKFKEVEAPKELAQVETKTIPAQVIREVARRADKKCEKCHSTVRLEFHHITPQSYGGKPTPSNLKLLCHNCHARESFTMGFRVPQRQLRT